MANTDFLAFQDVRQKLFLLVVAFENAIKRVVNEENSEFNSASSSFVRDINSIILNGTIGEELNILFNAYDIVGQTDLDQYVLSTQLFDFGDDDTLINNAQQQALNKFTINTAVQVNSLSLAFSNSVLVEYSNQSELSEIIAELNTQYNKVISTDLDSTTRETLLNLKTSTFSFLSELDIKSIIDITTTELPSTVLAYSYYKDSSRSNEIVNLNDIETTGFITGDIQIIST